MNVVVEGPDNSGKSTLVNYIAPRLGLTIVKGEGPPVSADEWAQRFLHDPPNHAIFDRHTAVSEPIYGPIIRGVDFSAQYPELIEAFYVRPTLFIYCRGDATLDGHVADHERDSDEHLALVEERHQLICDAYDVWALRHANIVRRKFDDMRPVLNMVRACQTHFMTRRGPFQRAAIGER